MQCEEHEFFTHHLLMDCKGGNENTKDEMKIGEFLSELGGVIGLSATRKCEFFYLSDSHKVSIVDNTCSVHIHFRNNGDFYLDILCQNPIFEVVKIRHVICKHFSPQRNKEILHKRGV